MTARKAMYALDMLTGRLVTVRGHKAKPKGPSIEWDVRLLDEHGDAQDVRHYDTEALAIGEAQDVMQNAGNVLPWCVAVVVERHDWRKHDAGDVCASYTTVGTFGSKAAVALWEGGAL